MGNANKEWKSVDMTVQMEATAGNKNTGGKRLGGGKDVIFQRVQKRGRHEQTEQKGTLQEESDGKLTGLKEVKEKVSREKSTGIQETRNGESDEGLQYDKEKQDTGKRHK